MYADHTLTPKEAVRFCALGILADRDLSYSRLTVAVRHFIDRVQGPSLDVLGTSIELLKYEGLVETANEQADDPLFEITDKGRHELADLLTANIRATDSDHNKLIEALKFRYLHLLAKPDQLNQADLLSERAEIELTRLMDLHEHYAQDPGHFLDWLDREIGEIKNRLVWLERFRANLTRAAP